MNGFARDNPAVKFRAIDLIFIATKLALAGVLIWAGVLKLSNPGDFLYALVTYRLMPFEVAEIVVAVLPMLEVVAGISILIRPLSRSAGFIAFLLGIGFVITQTQAMARGLNIACGCFGEIDAKVSVWTILRAAAVMLAGLWVWLRQAAGRDARPVDRV